MKKIISIAVCLFSISKNIDIFDKSEFDSQTDGIECAVLLSGHYKIKDDVATATIVEDKGSITG
ncbi:MAG: hypothetical protein IJ315_05890 [Firmicutes bacterium]|nr:hypothetical protein [Bacillota bacterium]